MSSRINKYPDNFRHIFIISGPSGVGKASVMRRILEKTGLVKIVNFTTRPKRQNEREGFDYRFISQDDFETVLREGKIAEYVRVYGDCCYGSVRLRHDPSGPDRLIELDPQGRVTYQDLYSPNITSIFLLPPSVGELKHRIEIRQHESNLESRLHTATQQIGHAQEYDYIIINDQLDVACDMAVSIVRVVQQRLMRDSLIRFANDLRKQ